MTLEDKLLNILNRLNGISANTIRGQDNLDLARQELKAICQLIDNEECPECRGKGIIPLSFLEGGEGCCPTCQGTGRIKREK